MRTYNQFCGLARALDLVGERWALLVVRELVLGPKRFTDLQAGLPGIGTNVLASRLRELEESGLIGRRTLPPPAASAVYELTEYGRDLEPTLLALGRWGARSLGQREPDQTLRSGWLGVALRAFARPVAAEGLRSVWELRLDDGVLHVTVDDGSVAVADGPAARADLVLEASNDVAVALLAGAVDADTAIATGAARVTGARELLDQLIDVFRFDLAEPAAQEA